MNTKKNNLTAKIEIESAALWTFGKVVSVEVTRDMGTFTDICVLELPKKALQRGEGSLPFRRGDRVRVWLGYDDELQYAFMGFITTFGSKTSMSITCEDYMFILKQTETKKMSYNSATLEQILKDQDLGGIEYKIFGEQNLGKYRVTTETVAELLADLKDKGGVRSFIKYENEKPVLYCGVLFDNEDTRRQVFATGLNIIDDSKLEEKKYEDQKIWITAVSLMPDNTKIKVEVGDEGGEKRTINAYNKTEVELNAWALQELKRLKQNGVAGSFTTFGAGLLDKLDIIGIKIDEERKGVYQVEKNVIKYSDEGFRQTITIGNKV